jgi:hypothetical protein
MSHFIYCYAECYYAEYRYAECCYAECHYVECRYAECRYAECRYAECRYAECRYTECRGAIFCYVHMGQVFPKMYHKIPEIAIEVVLTLATLGNTVQVGTI